METTFYKELKKSLLSYKKQRIYARQLAVFWIIAIFVLTFWTWFVALNDINSKVIMVGFVEVSFLFFIMYKFLLPYMLPFGNIEVTNEEIKKEIERILDIKEKALKDGTEYDLILEKEISILKEYLV